MSNTLSFLSAWCDAYSRSVNIDKTRILAFKGNFNECLLNNEPVPISQKEKDDHKLNWHDNLKLRCQKAMGCFFSDQTESPPPSIGVNVHVLWLFQYFVTPHKYGTQQRQI